MLLGSRTKRTSLVNSTTQTSIFKLGQFLASPISGTFMFASHVNCGCCRLSLIFVTSWRAARVAISDWWVPTSQLIFNHHFSHLSNNFHYCQIQFPQNICNQILILKKYHPIPLSLSIYIYKISFSKKTYLFPWLCPPRSLLPPTSSLPWMPRPAMPRRAFPHRPLRPRRARSAARRPVRYQRCP